jgi:hypothetical protein
MIDMSKIATKIGIKPTFKLENYFPFTLCIHVIDLDQLQIDQHQIFTGKITAEKNR